MDPQAVSALAVDKKTFSKHRPVPQRLNNTQMYGTPRDQVESTFQDGLRTDTRECSGPAQYEPPAMSPPYQGPSLVTVQLLKGVFFKPEDFETGFASPNQPQHVTQDQANGTSELSLTNTQMVSAHPQSSTVTLLSLPSTSSHRSHRDVILNSNSQPVVNDPTSKRKICESEKEFEDDDDSVQWLDDAHKNEESSPPAKKPKWNPKRPDNGHSKVVRQSRRQPAKDEQQNELDKQDGQVITLSLQCAKWNFSLMFTTNEQMTAVDQLNHHLKDVHSTGQHRCVVLYCTESFPCSYLLGQHLKQFHPGIDQWHCSKCPKHFASYRSLYQHKMGQHQIGQFECSFSACTFTAECRAKVETHYADRHRVVPELVCRAKAGCTFRTRSSRHHKVHERAHLIKPYQCDWRDCHYSSALRSVTIAHIKKVHFSTKTGSSDVVALYARPVYYLSVDRTLL